MSDSAADVTVPGTPASAVAAAVPPAAEAEEEAEENGTLLVPNRSRIDSYWVEMVMFLKANFSLIPAYKDIPRFPAKDIRKHLPARFNGKDEELLAAETAINPLVTTTPPTEGDMDVVE